MSTRAQIFVTDNDSIQQEHPQGILLYRHSDGGPDDVKVTLGEFINMVKNGKIRDNCEQAAGWLIHIGREEFAEYRNDPVVGGSMGWKVGAYEPSCCLHGDIEYFYIVNVEMKTVQYCDVHEAEHNKAIQDYLTREIGGTAAGFADLEAGVFAGLLLKHKLLTELKF